MEKFNNSQMPYKENEEYLDNLISEVTEKAIEKGRISTQRILWPIISTAVAAAVLLFVFLGNIGNNHKPTPTLAQNTDSPVDEFLENLSEDELMRLSYYDVESSDYNSLSTEDMSWIEGLKEGFSEEK